MLDFYRLGTDFPGVSSPEKGIGKVRRIESQLKEQIAGKIPNLRADRFIPYIQLHEFEALLFSDPDKFAAGIRQPGLANEFKAVRHQCGTPEDINLDQPPSHRLIEQYPAYQKNVDGVRGAKSVGIDSMRSECPHFREWLETLESLGPLSTKS
jgi:hypothetical protein